MTPAPCCIPTRSFKKSHQTTGQFLPNWHWQKMRCLLLKPIWSWLATFMLASMLVHKRRIWPICTGFPLCPSDFASPLILKFREFGLQTEKFPHPASRVRLDQSKTWLSSENKTGRQALVAKSSWFSPEFLDSQCFQMCSLLLQNFPCYAQSRRINLPLLFRQKPWSKAGICWRARASGEWTSLDSPESEIPNSPMKWLK